MSQLTTIGRSLPATSPEALDRLAVVQDALLRCEQIDIRTEHILHGGMYSRTLRLTPKDDKPENQIVALGALIRVPTIIVVHGLARVLVNDGWADVDGFNAFPASAGRKQMCVTRGVPVAWTMVFATNAKSVEEAEKEFTDEWELLLNSDEDEVIITGE